MIDWSLAAAPAVAGFAGVVLLVLSVALWRTAAASRRARVAARSHHYELCEGLA